MKRWLFLLAMPWTVAISSGIPGSHFINEMPRTELVNHGISFHVLYSTDSFVIDALNDMAEALNQAHERRTINNFVLPHGDSVSRGLFCKDWSKLTTCHWEER